MNELGRAAVWWLLPQEVNTYLIAETLFYIELDWISNHLPAGASGVDKHLGHWSSISLYRQL